MAAITLPSFAAAARALGLHEELFAALGERRTSPWIETARATARGDLTAAADLLERIGSLPDEAEARLLAAEQLAADRPAEAAEQLRRALAFYHSVGAEGFSTRGEAVLAETG